jgi:dTDP-4-amino-4,6-dideoxygalactose transaminase
VVACSGQGEKIIEIDLRKNNRQIYDMAVRMPSTAPVGTDATKAILPVHLHGLMADIDPIITVVRRHADLLQ